MLTVCSFFEQTDMEMDPRTQNQDVNTSRMKKMYIVEKYLAGNKGIHVGSGSVW